MINEETLATRMSSTPTLISIVVPVFNEEKSIQETYQQVKKLFDKVKKEYRLEFIFVNDGSQDNSWQEIQSLAKEDTTVKGLNFSRNFGQQIALSAGYELASGAAIISMDCDLQDPPQLILDLLKKWEEGYDIVYARRQQRTDGFLKGLTANLYYRLLHSFSEVDIPRNVGDFRLLDHKVLRELNRFKEKSRYLRGMVAWLGFRSAFIEFNRPNRQVGQSRYTWKKMVRLASDGLASFSNFPLQIASYFGWVIILISLTLLAYLLIRSILFQSSYSFSLWLMAILFFFMGIQFLFLWLLGEYIGRIYDQAKDRPLYVVQDRLNIEEKS